MKPEATPKPKFDPFKDPSPELLLARFPPEAPTHALVLNKFPVIPNHFLLITTDWKAQTDLLEKADLEATYDCLQTWSADKSDRRLFAFFNSGEESGASQPHRHLQFLPVEAMRQPEAESWDPLIELLAADAQSSSASTFQQLPQVPFTHFALPLPPNASPETLHSIYISLYRAALAATQGRDPQQGPAGTVASEGPSLISYNFAMTLDTMLVCPRRQETANVPVDLAAARDIADPGIVSLNGTILAGTLMVKAEGEWDALRSNPEYLSRVLATVGYPRADSRGNSVL